jgi:catechol 2,3-dioxygenase-like lactoylglutathione lyase family enzyme
MPAMLDHIAIQVSDVDRARAFYTGAFAPLGHEVVRERPTSVGFGINGKPEFFIREGPATELIHVAVSAPDRPTVDAFHAAALAAGGVDNGGPGIREIYHPNYYAAFVWDPDGNNIEAVCHTPPAG